MMLTLLWACLRISVELDLGMELSGRVYSKHMRDPHASGVLTSNYSSLEKLSLCILLKDELMFVKPESLGSFNHLFCI